MPRGSSFIFSPYKYAIPISSPTVETQFPKLFYKRKRNNSQKKKMGLQSQLNDVSSDSIPLLLVAIIAKSLYYLRSFHFAVFGNLRLLPPHAPVDERVILQRKRNRELSYSYSSSGAGDGSICIICRSRPKDGEKVRKLDCRHVFHKHCLDGWLDHLKFSCPICRRPIECEQRVGVGLAERLALR